MRHYYCRYFFRYRGERNFEHEIRHERMSDSWYNGWCQCGNCGRDRPRKHVYFWSKSRRGNGMWRGGILNIKHQFALSCPSRAKNFGKGNNIHGSRNYTKSLCLIGVCECLFVPNSNTLKTIQVPKLRTSISSRKSDDRFVKVLQQIGSGRL